VSSVSQGGARGKQNTVEEFKYLVVVFTSDWRRNKEIDTVHGLVKQTQFCEFYRSVVTNQSFQTTHDIAVSFQIDFFSDPHILWGFGHES